MKDLVRLPGRRCRHDIPCYRKTVYQKLSVRLTLVYSPLLSMEPTLMLPDCDRMRVEGQ